MVAVLGSEARKQGVSLVHGAQLTGRHMKMRVPATTWKKGSLVMGTANVTFIV